jgi:hypothetical protein
VILSEKEKDQIISQLLFNEKKKANEFLQKKDLNELIFFSRN